MNWFVYFFMATFPTLLLSNLFQHKLIFTKETTEGKMGGQTNAPYTTSRFTNQTSTSHLLILRLIRANGDKILSPDPSCYTNYGQKWLIYSCIQTGFFVS